ncbi:MAG TPA: sulfotransferase [Tepidisphaeraceae bacterium]|jgi:hypothetical protein
MFLLPSSSRWLGRAESARPSMAFIVGCARSGTSILGELIAAHPSVKYVFEATKVWESIGRRPDGSHRLTAADTSWGVRRRIRRQFARCHGHCEPGGVVIEKCPRNALRIPFLHRMFAHARFIHIIRDGRDVACSLVPGLASGRWQHLRPPDWRQIETQYEGVARCAMAWRSIVELAMEDLREVPHLEVRYEDLVCDPLEAAQAILRFLELDDSPAVAEFAGRVQNETAGSYQAQFQVRWFRNDHATRIGRWRENLSPREQGQVHELIGPLLWRLGYGPEQPNNQPVSSFREAI